MLSARLQAIADWVPACGRVLDIGTDHALLPIWLLQDGRCSRAQASDLRKGPAERALYNARLHAVGDRLEVSVRDGLGGQAINPDDVIIMAGLGGMEMIHILDTRPVQEGLLILQPQRSLPELRVWLAVEGYTILTEKLCQDRGHFYILLKVRWQGESRLPDLLEAWLGRGPYEPEPENHPMWRHYRLHLAEQLGKSLQGRPELEPVLVKIQSLLTPEQINR